MGPEPIKIPDHFTVAWYMQQKELRKNDESIATELLISRPLLQTWKKKIGYMPYTSRNIAGRKRKQHDKKR